MKPDREKVIDGLNDIHAVACGLGGDQCYLNGIGIKQLQALVNDATELLKAQEPVEPIYDEDNYIRCGKCKHHIVGIIAQGTGNVMPMQNYCAECGQAVKWE